MTRLRLVYLSNLYQHLTIGIPKKQGYYSYQELLVHNDHILANAALRFIERHVCAPA